MAKRTQKPRVRLPSGRLMCIVSDWRPEREKHRYSARDVVLMDREYKAWLAQRNASRSQATPDTRPADTVST